MLRKQFLAILSLFFSISLCAQFTDNFANSELDTSWNGTREKFKIVADGDKNLLQLHDTAAISGNNRAYLSRESEAILSAEWQISFDIKTTLTSSNYVRFYVVSDNSDLTSELDGYFVRIGHTDKEIALFRQNQDKTTKLIDGENARATGNSHVDIKLTRDKHGTWELFSKIGDETNFTSEGTCVDNANLTANFSGFSIYYSKTNNQNYACNFISASGEKYTIPEQEIKKNDLVFSEIFADPEPQVGLPTSEFLEIYNRTDKIINLSGWKLCVNGKAATIPEGEIDAKSYVILCAENAAEAFRPFGKTIAVDSWHALTNDGALVTLCDAQNRLVAWVDFSAQWYNDEFKQDGGWSLERVNVDYLDNHAKNWQPSENEQGGTPAMQNSIAENLQDERIPYLCAVAANRDTITLFFSKTMDDFCLTQTANFDCDIAIDTILIEQPHAKTVHLVLSEVLSENLSYQLVCKNLFCVDSLPMNETEIIVSQPVAPEVGDIVINEILFNPQDDGVDFVEILNISDKTIDLSQIFVTRRKNDAFEARTTLCNAPILFPPNTFLTLTESSEIVCQQYDCPENAHFLEVKLPSLPDSEGNIALVLTNETVLDELNYSEKMHHAFVTNAEGVSLERVNPHAPTQQKDNWQSAAFDVGYGTPCRQNSQYIAPESEDTKKNFWFEYETFTPDNDGFRDLLLLNYSLPNDGFSASITIFTPTGIRVRKLLNNALLSTEGYLTWDGKNADETLCNPGIYVLVVEAITPNGDKIQQKLVCVLSMR